MFQKDKDHSEEERIWSSNPALSVAITCGKVAEGGETKAGERRRKTDRERYRQNNKARMDLQLLPVSVSGSGSGSGVIGSSCTAATGANHPTAVSRVKCRQKLQIHSSPFLLPASLSCGFVQALLTTFCREKSVGVRGCFCGMQARRWRRIHPALCFIS
ncbi:Hypothetical predicted protein [Podarcis lilfordi]|uniref:Uncharacterized protein n=1 Tax=Podarcis lilfordi TaxID=74358 RepID=A0AA35K357_9SAUR|nr:Hypothetical predicted protein [Podarcis lilfordi]